MCTVKTRNNARFPSHLVLVFASRCHVSVVSPSAVTVPLVVVVVVVAAQQAAVVVVLLLLVAVSVFVPRVAVLVIPGYIPGYIRGM